MTSSPETWREKEAMNIVYQIGDILSEYLPKDCQDTFVDARQKTNDRAIEFVGSFLTAAKKEARVDAQRAAESVVKVLEATSGKGGLVQVAAVKHIINQVFFFD